MDVNGRRSGSLSWRSRDEPAAVVDAGLNAAARSAGSALLLPAVVAGSALLYALRGGVPRISGSVGRAERTALRRALRRRLAELMAGGAAFRLSSVLPFPWRRAHVIGQMEDARAAFPHLDVDAARRLGSDRGDVLVIVRAPEGLVRIDLGPDYGLVAADPAGLEGPDVVVSTISIAGVRHLHLAAASEPPGAA